MYLINKKFLKYAQIVVTHANSRVLDFEGHSSTIAITILNMFSVAPRTLRVPIKL